jgi:protein-S-isoprenylcysteine O-methyltransferase Ste14
LGFLAIAVTMNWEEHRAHILGVLPYLFLLACPLMHLLMHGGRVHEAQADHSLAMTGPYGVIRHPQYAAFVVIMSGFLLQWPTLLTVAMFPILTVMYLRLAMNEELDMRKTFGQQWDAYASRVPAFIPRFGGSGPRKNPVQKAA